MRLCLGDCVGLARRDGAMRPRFHMVRGVHVYSNDVSGCISGGGDPGEHDGPHRITNINRYSWNMCWCLYVLRDPS